MILNRVEELNGILLQSLAEVMDAIQAENQADLKQFKLRRIEMIREQLLNDEDISEEEFKDELAMLIKDVDQKKLQFKSGQRKILENIVDQYSAQLKKTVLGDMPIYIEDHMYDSKAKNKEVSKDKDIITTQPLTKPKEIELETTIEIDDYIKQVKAKDNASVMEKLEDIKKFDVKDDSEVVTKELDDWIAEIKKII